MLFYEPTEIINAEYFRNKTKYHQRNYFVDRGTICDQRTVSFVTACMDRLHDLKRTLPRNIDDNISYPGLEFVVLDYNSTDGLGKWIEKNMWKEIDAGRLVYYRTDEPKYFQPNHARNVCFRVARGDVVANIDSDNFTHKDYAKRINQCVSVADERVLVLPENFLQPKSRRLFLRGRFALYRKDIELLRGFDEDLDEGFGNDDVNFVFRAMMDGFKLVRYESYFTEDRLPTSNEERVSLVKNKNYQAVRDRNGELTWAKLARGVVSVNRNRHWGKATLTRNFSDVIST